MGEHLLLEVLPFGVNSTPCILQTFTDVMVTHFNNRGQTTVWYIDEYMEVSRIMNNPSTRECWDIYGKTGGLCKSVNDGFDLCV